MCTCASACACAHESVSVAQLLHPVGSPCLLGEAHNGKVIHLPAASWLCVLLSVLDLCLPGTRQGES